MLATLLIVVLVILINVLGIGSIALIMMLMEHLFSKIYKVKNGKETKN